MYVKPFRYVRAETLADAAAWLRDADGDAKVIAGGQSLLPMVNLGLVDLEAVIDISRVTEARRVSSENGYLRIGALTRHTELERDRTIAGAQPLVGAAAGWIGSDRIRRRGTLGGSLAHSDPAAELPLAMIALGATYDLVDGTAQRTVAADEFHLGYFTTALADDELLQSVRVPILGPGWGWGFQEVSRRLGDFAIVAAAALVRLADGLIVESRLALGGVADRPLRLGAVEASVTGATDDELSDRIGPVEAIEPTGDTSATADYRRHLARILSVRVLSDACRRAREAA